MVSVNFEGVKESMKHGVAFIRFVDPAPPPPPLPVLRSGVTQVYTGAITGP